MTKTVKDKNDYLSRYYQVERTNSEINIKLGGGIPGRSLFGLGCDLFNSCIQWLIEGTETLLNERSGSSKSGWSRYYINPQAII